MIFSILGLVYYFSIKNFLAKKSKETSYFHNKLFNILTNALEDIKFIKVINCEKKYIDSHGVFQSKVIDAEKFSTFFTRLPRAILELFGILVFIISIFYFLKTNNDTSLIISELSIFGFAILRLIPIFSIIVSNFTNIKYFHKSFVKITEEITKNKNNNMQNIYEKNNTPSDTENLRNIKNINLKDINFKYESSTELVLKDVSVNFEYKKITGIKGSSGSGKSTLIAILLGLLNPLDGKRIFEFDNNFSAEDAPKNTFGYVPQNIFLIDDSIRRNIALGIDDDKINDEKIIECLKHANIYEKFINSKDKLNTNLGYRGLKLSGGQIQRIGIARALYLNPKFIILDEATNALDEITEQKVITKILKKFDDKILICISHNKHLLNKIHNKYKIENAQLVSI
jgi:ABC-type multidrug transport system fused ATPase/permease subunit